MPFGPCSEETRKRLEDKIEEIEKRVTLDQKAVASLRAQLAEGEWYLSEEEHKEMLVDTKEQARKNQEWLDNRIRGGK